MLIQWRFFNCNKKRFQVFTCSFIFCSKHQNFRRKHVTNFVRKVSSWFSFLCWVFMFTPFFHISFCLSNLFFSTWAFTPIYNTRRMWVFAFDFEQWFYLSCYLSRGYKRNAVIGDLRRQKRIFDQIWLIFLIDLNRPKTLKSRLN